MKVTLLFGLMFSILCVQNAYADEPSLNCYTTSSGGFFIQYRGINKPSTRSIMSKVLEENPQEVVAAGDYKLEFKKIGENVYQAQAQPGEPSSIWITIIVTEEKHSWGKITKAIIQTSGAGERTEVDHANCDYR